jgi:hypothetical protein
LSKPAEVLPHFAAADAPVTVARSVAAASAALASIVFTARMKFSWGIRKFGGNMPV